jgi:predicted nucleic acid-binding protein
MSRFILDASFALTWVVESERTAATLKHLDALSRQEAEAVVPALWPDEIANVMLTLERNGKLNSAQVLKWCETFLVLPIVVMGPSMAESFGEVRSLAQAHSLSAYDARYVHLAIKEGLPVATRDRAIIAAAPKLGIKLVSGSR